MCAWFSRYHLDQCSFSVQGFEYSRSGNPNRAAFERILVSLEAGAGHAIAFASGSATTATILQSLGPDAHVLSVNDVYGGTFRYFMRVASATMGTETTFVDFENATDDEILGALKENTKVCFPAYQSRQPLIDNSSYGSNHQQTPPSD